ncbi:hypothetical protein HN011_004503 [Eciton burchellii]|nr:hypothetical protein HN011_004503 [Eciton burchellii]
MICLEAQYFNLNRILLQGIALWPFQQSKFVQLQFIIIFIILVTAIISQITIFATTKYTFKLALKIFSCVLPFIAVLIHYNSFRINIKILKNLMTQLHNACIKLKDKNEISIVQRYGWEAKRYITAFLLIFFLLESTFWASQIILPFLDIVENRSQSHPLEIETEYFIDQEKYFYIILIHMNTAIFIGILSLIAMAALLIAYFQHTCAMFKIACYRMEHTVEINVLKNISLGNEPSISKKIVYAVNIHRDAIKLSELLVSSFDTTYFCLTMFSVIALSLNLFQIFQNIASTDNITEISFPIVLVLVLTFYMFFANYFGQSVIDHSNGIYRAAYNIRWYMCPVHVQKLIVLLLQRRAKEFHLTCGGLFVASFECFATLVKATMSYFTFMHSTR